MDKDINGTIIEIGSKYSNYTKKGNTEKESNLAGEILKEIQRQQNEEKVKE